MTSKPPFFLDPASKNARMNKPTNPDARVFDTFMRRESETSTAESSAANSNTSYSTAPTPASISSPGQIGSVGKEEYRDEDMLDVDAKPAPSSLDSLLRPSPSGTTSSTSQHNTADPSEVASSKKPSIQAIVTHLESVVRTFIEAINDRNLILGHPVTSSFDPKFSANTPPPWPQGTENLTQYLQRLIGLAAETEYKMLIQSLDTHVYKNGHAGVFVTSDVIGVPPGVVRHVVAIFRFRKRDGSWRCFTVEEVIGIENTGDGDAGGGFAGPF